MKATIVGGGIAGLTVAVGLEKYGFDYQLFEATSEFKTAGAGIILSPNALFVLDRLGLYDEIAEAGHPLRFFNVTDEEGELIQKNDTTYSLHGKTYEAIGIHRATLQKLLLSNIDRPKLNLGHSLEKIDLNQSSLHFHNGKVVKSDLILGCDGIHSATRKVIFPEVSLRYSGQTCWRGIAQLSMEDDQLPQQAEMWGSGVRFGFVPISKEQVYWYATAVTPAGQKDQSSAQTKQNLASLFKNFAPHVLKIIDATENTMRHDLIDFPPLESWSKRNILLVGDAAHAMTPNMGQGAAQSIEDAWSLVNVLQMHTDLQDVFTAYENARLEKANSVNKLSWRIGQMTNPTNRLICNMRNRLLRFAPQAAAEKQRAKLFFVPSYSAT